MLRLILVIFLGVTLLAASAEAHVRKPAQPATASPRLPVTVRQLAPIAFGTFAASIGGGTVTIDAASGARITSGAISTLNSSNYGQAEFIISGQPGEEVLISPPASAQIGGANGSGGLIMTNFKVSPGTIVTLNREGIAKISIGSTLKLPGSVSQGGYNGLFNITAHYLH